MLIHNISININGDKGIVGYNVCWRPNSEASTHVYTYKNSTNIYRETDVDT